MLYDLVKDARNDALHQGAFARHLTSHAIELALVLEDALRRRLDSPVVGDYMVRNHVCAELWQPISFIRQQMLANSFSFLPVKSSGRDWCLISDLDIATYLGPDALKRKPRLAQTLNAAKIPLQLTKPCAIDTPLEEALRRWVRTGSLCWCVAKSRISKFLLALLRLSIYSSWLSKASLPSGIGGNQGTLSSSFPLSGCVCVGGVKA